MPGSEEPVLELLRDRGLRMTPQRRVIVAEIMATEGHITPTAVAERVRARVPGVNASTIYRTMELLENVGVLSHAHLESGPEYHRSAEAGHVHLACSRCGAEESLSIGEAEEFRRLLIRTHGFRPDLSHFAIGGLCERCHLQGR